MPKKWTNRKAELHLHCSQCGKNFTRTLGQLEDNPEFSCPTAGCRMVFDASDPNTGVNAFDKITEKVIRNIRKLHRGK